MDKARIQMLSRRKKVQDSKKVKENCNGKIISPIAKYDSQGNLSCIICKADIKSANVWKVHVNSKQHKTKVELAKQHKHNFLEPTKNPKISEVTTVSAPIKGKEEDNKTKPASELLSKEVIEEGTTQKLNTTEDNLPEMFFDDPIRDAKARNVEYKNKQDEEWIQFQREISEASVNSYAIISVEQDDANLSRQLKEIDEQMERWAKVIEIEGKKKKVLKEKTFLNSEINHQSDDSDYSCDEEELDLSDWRSKNLMRP